MDFLFEQKVFICIIYKIGNFNMTKQLQSTQTKVESETSSESNVTAKPTWQEIEKAIIEIVKASLAFNMPKTGNFLKSWKRKINELRHAEDLDQYSIENAKRLFPNETQFRKKMIDTKEWYQYKVRLYKALISYYNLNYIIAKDYFKSEEEIEKEADDFLNEPDNEEDEFEKFMNL